MTKQQIICFLNLCQTGNFTRTAELLYVTQPVVSRQISTLEKELGFTLFQRNHQSVNLTPAGTLMANYFRHAMNEYRLTVERAASYAHESRDTISIALLELFDNTPILTVIGRYSNIKFLVERYPHPCNHNEILSGHFDIAVLFGRQMKTISGLEYHEILRSQDYLLLSKHHSLADEPERAIEMIQEIHVVSNDGITPASFDRERQNECGLARCKINLLPNISSVLALTEIGTTGTVIQGFSLPHIKFDYVAIPLNSFMSVGLALRSSDSRPNMRSFLKQCKKEFSFVQYK